MKVPWSVGPILLALVLGMGAPHAFGEAGTVVPGLPTRVATMEDLGRHLALACRDPVLERAGIEVSVRFSLRADGSLFGGPVVIGVRAPGGPRIPLDVFRARAAATFAACMPVPLSAEMGRSLAGRQIGHVLGRALSHRPRPPFGPRDVAI